MNLAEASMTNLADLTELSKQVNEQSDQVNQVLQDLEKKLVAMNLGVEAWVRVPLDSNPYLLNTVRNRIDKVLGFGRHGDRYALLVRTVTSVRRYHDETGEWVWDCQEAKQRPLLQASRELRVKALVQTELLLDVIAREAQSVLEAIQKGRKAVDNI